MQAALVRLVERCGDHTGLLALGSAPGINSVPRQTISNEKSKHHDGRMQADHTDAECYQNNDGKRHSLFHLNVLEAVKRDIGDHRQARVQGQNEHQPGDLQRQKVQIQCTRTGVVIQNRLWPNTVIGGIS